MEHSSTHTTANEREQERKEENLKDGREARISVSARYLKCLEPIRIVN
jgi:hypothetical protein